MSDSFADLWSSSAPLPPKPKPQTLSSASTSFTGNSTFQRPTNTARTNVKPDVFTLLASSGNSTPTPRYGTGTGLAGSSSANLTGSAPASRPLTPAMSRSNSGTPAPAAAGTSSGDAFSDLFSSSSNGNANGSTKMTLAARLAMEAQQRGRSPGLPSALGQQQAKQQQQGGAGHHDSVWTGLDSLAAGGLGASTKIGTSKPAVVDDDDWGLGEFGAPSKTATNTTQGNRRIPQSQPQPQQKKATTLWDLDDFTSSPPPAHSGSGSGSLLNDTQRSASRSTSSQGTRKEPLASSLLDDAGFTSPDADFDFGNREDEVDETTSWHHPPKSGKGRQQRAGLLDLDGDEDRGYPSTRKGLLNDDDAGDDGWGHAPATSTGRRRDEDDILGMLSQPVEVVRATVSGPTQDADHARSRNGRPDPTRSHGSRPGASSPPPHILGQIVEMGFSVEQAKKALKQTKDGQDVQAALESLLGGGGPAEESHSGGGGYTGERDRPRPSNSAPVSLPPALPRAAPKGQKERERERLERQRQGSLREGGEGSGSPASVADIQEQADKLMAQASEIGLSVFSKASAFWKEGKEKVVKAYEERSGDVGGRGGAPVPGGGRPKWMQEVVHQSDDEDEPHRNQGGFKDTHEREEVIPRRPNVKVEEAKADLFSDFSDPVPRHSNPAPKQRPNPVRQVSSSSQSQQRKPPQQRQPAPPPPTRSLPTASSSALAVAAKHKTVGTEQFKLGQHAAAAESYSAAIAALPEGHLLLVPLHTNRALSRLKTGEYVGAVGDCEKAVEGVFGKPVFSSAAGKTAIRNDDGFGFEDPLAHKMDASSSSNPPPLLQPSVIPPNLLSAGRSRANEGGWTHPQGVGVDLLDGYVKALRRAAEACEGREKWVDAGVWWSVLSRAGESEGGGWVEEKTRKEAVSGGVRCRKMLDQASGAVSLSVTGLAKAAGPTSISRPPTKPKPKPRPPPAASSEPSRALLALQNTTAQAESEDAAKHALKDTVDARLSAWKTGKETNVRALLASLESVLWEGAISGGLKMGMADLVSPAQVKKGYVKAIAKLHPDKLNASNSTVEQRMLANGVFGTLNEAWIAFQATQK